MIRAQFLELEGEKRTCLASLLRVNILNLAAPGTDPCLRAHAALIFLYVQQKVENVPREAACISKWEAWALSSWD